MVRFRLVRRLWSFVPGPRATLRLTLQTGKYSVQIFCLSHLFNEHLFETAGSEGPSMLPTVAMEGDNLLHIRLPFLRFCNQVQQRWARLVSGSDDDNGNDPFYTSRTWGHKNIGGPSSIKTDQSQGTGLRVGDIVVAISPMNPERTVCKRLVGLPGDTICVDPRMGPIPDDAWKGRNPSHSTASDDPSSPTATKTAAAGAKHGDAGSAVYGEVDLLRSMDSSDLPSSAVNPSTLRHDEANSRAFRQQSYLRSRGEVQYVTVPSGHVWLVGDNLAKSTDSRHYGPVPMGLLRGKVLARAFPHPAWLTNDTPPTS
ncbi:hypothetical protein ACQY0O_006604 [Thecaphora frezii]